MREAGRSFDGHQAQKDTPIMSLSQQEVIPQIPGTHNSPSSSRWPKKPPTSCNVWVGLVCFLEGLVF